jgi:hypothetical protein
MHRTFDHPTSGRITSGTPARPKDVFVEQAEARLQPAAGGRVVPCNTTRALRLRLLGAASASCPTRTRLGACTTRGGRGCRCGRAGAGTCRTVRVLVAAAQCRRCRQQCRDRQGSPEILVHEITPSVGYAKHGKKWRSSNEPGFPVMPADAASHRLLHALASRPASKGQLPVSFWPVLQHQK